MFNGGVVAGARSALGVVAGKVRELIRRHGLDPFVDPAPVRVLGRDVLADYSERSLSSALPPLQRYLDDPEVEEIWVNEPGGVRGPAGPVGADDDGARAWAA